MRNGWRLMRNAAGSAALAYGAYAGYTWLRYGRPDAHAAPEPLLDRFMPVCEVRERHHARVDAPAAVTYAAAQSVAFDDSPVVRALFALRAAPASDRRRRAQADGRPLRDRMMDIGWGVLEEQPGREIVFGAVTQPWKADVVFRPLAPADFAAFAEPGFAKIAWNLAVESDGPDRCRFRTETRVATTDAESRRLFRRYWAALSPGIILIRYEMLRMVKNRAASFALPVASPR